MGCAMSSVAVMQSEDAIMDEGRQIDLAVGSA